MPNFDKSTRQSNALKFCQINLQSVNLQNEIETLFSSPFEEKDISTDNQAILDLMTFEGNRKQFIKDKKAEGMTLEEAKELYKDALDEKVKAALPESFDEEE